MKHPFQHLGALLLLAAIPHAQSAEPPPPSETVKLNPFVVSESDSVGYSANSTLAGTRINTALRDVGAAISIITPSFSRTLPPPIWANSSRSPPRPKLAAWRATSRAVVSRWPARHVREP
jgi:hypothetical protein